MDTIFSSKTKAELIEEVIDKNRKISELETFIQNFKKATENSTESDNSLNQNESRFRYLFEYSPISLWEEDASDVKFYIDDLKNNGITDFRSYFDNYPDKLIYAASLIKIIDVNTITLKLYKINSKNEFFQGLNSIFSEESYQVFKEELLTFIEGKSVFTSESVQLTNSGVKFDTLITVALPGVANGDWSKMYVSIIDISENKIAQKIVKESEEKLKMLFDSIYDSIYIIDIDNLNITDCNSAALTMYNYTYEEITKLKITDLSAEPELSLLTIQNNDKHIPLRYHKKKDGTAFPVEINANYIQYNKRNLIIASARDITKRLKIEEELKKSADEISWSKHLLEEQAGLLFSTITELEESEQALKDSIIARDKFFSIIAHDLRSPFTGFLGLSEVMTKDVDELSLKEIKELSKTIHDSANNIYKLLEVLLQWSNLQIGKMPFNPEKIELDELIVNILFLLKDTARIKNIKLSNFVNKGTFVKADANMLMTIIRNLIANGIKFTMPGGEVKIESCTGNNCLEIKVSDTGIGMSQDTIAKLFKIDLQHSTLGTSEERGTGLGLILCKEFIERHGGTIQIESELGNGSAFIFTLPNG
ncbi:MAG: ATP-binding protein [FCB group bacterium]|jgi:PAS domain S-box-containing protein